MNHSTLNLLNQKIDLLKRDIQETIDSIKLENIYEKKKKLQDKKVLLLDDLDTTLSQVKQIQKDEKKKINSENEIKKIIRTNDSIKYYSVKNKPNSIQLMKEQKDNREKAKDIFEKKLKLKNDYNDLEEEYNCTEFPAFLFFDKEITDKYNLCPFIELNETTLEDRKKWLNETCDKGKLYHNLYNKLINKDTLNSLLLDKQSIEKHFYDIHDNFNDEDKKSLKKVYEYIEEYKSANVKTKKLKEKFNIIINNISIIIENNDIKINEFLSLSYNITIPSNSMCNLENKKNKITNIGISKLYDEYLENYSKVKNDLDSANKFIFNKTNNLNQELYDYLYKKSNDKKYSKQIGKYFKKWSDLLHEEKIDRFESYANYFPRKYLLEPNIITDEIHIVNLIEELKILITIDGIERIKYKNLKWNIITGVIDNINCLKFNNEDNKFFLTIEKENIKNKSTIKKASSIRTVLNKDINKIINDELMRYLIVAKKQKKLIEKNIKDLKENFLDKIKEKLKLKRIILNDRIEINKKFDEIYNLIIHSNYPESN